MCGFFKGDPHNFIVLPLYSIVESTLDLEIQPRSNLQSLLRPIKPFPSFSQVQETSRSPLLANKAAPTGRKLTSPSTPLLRPRRTPTPQTFLPHLLPRRRSLRFNPFRPPQRERGRLMTTHLLHVAIMFPEETRALERKYQALSQRLSERSPLLVCGETRNTARRAATTPHPTATPAGVEVRGSELPARAGLVLEQPPWDSDV